MTDGERTGGERTDADLARSLDAFRETSLLARYPLGQAVSKKGGDYRFDGIVVSVVRKLSGAIRYVVEDDRGVLFIFNESQLSPKGPE